MNERDIERYLVKRVKANGGEIRKVKWIGRKNAPDRLVMLPFDYGCGQSFFVEVKRPGEEPTAAQAREHERMNACGLYVYVVDSFDRVDDLFR